MKKKIRSNENSCAQNKTEGTNYLRFQKIKKSSATLPIGMNSTMNKSQQNLQWGMSHNQNPAASVYNYTNRKYIYDQQTMNEMIIALKEENNQLKNVVKIQQTQICYFEEQEKSYILANANNGFNQAVKADDKNRNAPVKKNLELQNFRLKKQVQKLEQQIAKMKKTIKLTNIKQLQTQNTVYQQQLKNLTARLTAYQKSTNNVTELNKIIENQYYTSLKNKDMQRIISQKSSQIQQSAKIIRKLKNIISQKNNQIQEFKQERQKVQLIINKHKNNQEFVPKSELITKKKQLLVMTEAIQKLQMKLMQCQAKAQSLQQENIENMNRQTNKRKQILTEFQKLKKSHEALEQALALSLRKNSDVLPTLRLDKMGTLDTQFRKPKIPLTVRPEHIRQASQNLIFNLQTNGIDYLSAIGLLKPWHHIKKQNQQEIEEQISVRDIINCLEQYPISLQNYQHREILARYMVENQTEVSQYVNYDERTNISYVRSIFKRILHEYPIFSTNQIQQHCIFAEDFLKRNQQALKNTLGKMLSQALTKKQNQGQLKQNSQYSLGRVEDQNKLNQAKKGVYKCSDIYEAILKQNQLNEITLQFIKFWTYKSKDCFFSFKQYEQMFKREGVCMFITQQPDSVLDANENTSDKQFHQCRQKQKQKQNKGSQNFPELRQIKNRQIQSQKVQ